MNRLASTMNPKPGAPPPPPPNPAPPGPERTQTAVASHTTGAAEACGETAYQSAVDRAAAGRRSAFSAREWTALWVYFTAPPLGMFIAALVYRFRRGARAVFCAKLHHDNNKRCIFRCNYRAM